MYNALDVAKYVIGYCRENGYSVSNLKLQKILYFIQAEFLISNGNPCFVDQIEAWDFGPVVPSVYHEYKEFGSSNIVNFVDSGRPARITNRDAALIDGIIDECSGYSASALVEITHNQRPWVDAYQKYYNNPISNDSIEEYFSD